MSSSLFDPYQVTRNPKRIQYSGQVLRRKRVNKKPGCFSNDDLETAFKVLQSYGYVYYPFRPFTYPFTSSKTFTMDHGSSTTFNCIIDFNRITTSLLNRYNSDISSLPFNDPNYQIYFSFQILSYTFSAFAISTDIDRLSSVSIIIYGSINPGTEPNQIHMLESGTYTLWTPYTCQLNISARNNNEYYCTKTFGGDQLSSFYLPNSNSTVGREIFKYEPSESDNNLIYQYLSQSLPVPASDPGNLVLFQPSISQSNISQGHHRFNCCYALEIGVITLPGAPLFNF